MELATMDTNPLKCCSKCKEEKPATTEFFHRHTQEKDGLRSHCKSCILAIHPPQWYVVPEEGKRCTLCEVVKPATAKFFSRHKGQKSGLATICKDCRTKKYYANSLKEGWSRRRFYRGNPDAKRFTIEDYELMLFRQAGVCAVCGKPEPVLNPRTNEPVALSIDHNHETGEVRELLCSSCNFLLGYIEKDRERIKKLLTYLKKHDQ